MIRMVNIIVMVALLLWPAAGQAGGDSPLKPLLTGNDSRGWEAVGLLELGGVAVCTGALIAEDLVLTAAHCLFDPRQGRRFAPGEIVFRAGWRGGRANAVAGIAQAITHPDFRPEAEGSIGRVASDLALLRLQAPVRKSSVRPFETGPRPRKGDAVAVVSYGRGRLEAPALEEGCKVLARRAGTMVLNCTVDYGSSGAPVFARDEHGHMRIVSVITAKAEVDGRQVSLGASLERPLANLMSLLANSERVPPAPRIGVRVLTLGAGQGRSDGGAKFLRP